MDKLNMTCFDLWQVPARAGFGVQGHQGSAEDAGVAPGVPPRPDNLGGGTRLRIQAHSALVRCVLPWLYVVALHLSVGYVFTQDSCPAVS